MRTSPSNRLTRVTLYPMPPDHPPLTFRRVVITLLVLLVTGSSLALTCWTMWT